MNQESMKAGTDGNIDTAREQIRMKLWSDAYVAHIPNISTSNSYAKSKADEALAAFDKQFQRETSASRCPSCGYIGVPVP